MYKRIFLSIVLIIHFNCFCQIDLDLIFESDEKVTNIISYEDNIYFSTYNTSGDKRKVILYKLKGKEKVEIFCSDGYPINFIETSEALFFTTFDFSFNDRVYRITKDDKCKLFFESLKGQLRDIHYINKDSLLVCGNFNYLERDNFFISNLNGDLTPFLLKDCPRIFKIIGVNTNEFLLNTSEGIYTLEKSDFTLKNKKEGNYSIYQEGDYYGIHKVSHDSVRRFNIYNSSHELIFSKDLREIKGFKFYDYGETRNSISLIQKSYSKQKIMIEYFDFKNSFVKLFCTKEFSNIKVIYVLNRNVFVIDERASKYYIYSGKF